MRAYRAMNRAQAKLYSSLLELIKDVARNANYILDNYVTIIDASRLN